MTINEVAELRFELRAFPSIFGLLNGFMEQSYSSSNRRLSQDDDKYLVLLGL